jgi:pyridinium-3,5-bisthiocarboxylic acid mononucleotide nickel chelatase
MESIGAAEDSKVLYFDCYSGISGDMTLGALLDLGLEVEKLRWMLSGLKLGGYRLETEQVNRGGIAGTKANVILEAAEPVTRHLSDILQIIDSSDLPRQVKENSAAVFQRLAEAEASVHGTALEKVHFHEVGAVDAIVDIVGTAAALYLLGISEICCSPLPLGGGEVQTEHGRLPLPAPATLELIARRQIPVKGRDVQFELVTPTGAALVATLAKSFGPMPDFTIQKVGYGAGSHDPGYPNYLRTILGEKFAAQQLYEEEVLILETNIDDLNPEIFGYLMDKIFEAGALDLFFTPVQMKKNRPSVQLTVLSPPHLQQKLQTIIFNETSTLGLRVSKSQKIMRQRETLTVETKWGPIRVKYATLPKDQFPFSFAPEYEDCRQVAAKSGVPLREVYRLAEILFRKQF